MDHFPASTSSLPESGALDAACRGYRRNLFTANNGNNVRKEVRQMDRETRIVEITPELLVRLKRARAAAFVIFVGFFTMFVLFAPEGDPQVASRPAVQASR
jgi:hypothetical protein